MAEYFPIDVSSLGSYSGSFSGSFFGNGSGLTGITASFFSGSVTSASYAATASYLLGSIASASYAATASYLDVVNHIDFNTASASPSQTARLVWNDVDGTLELGLKGGVVKSELGQGLITRIVNKTVPNIYLSGSSYQVVVVAGAQGQRLAVKLAQADNDTNSAGTLGLVAENIAKNQEGFIVTVGLLKDIDTTGALQGETWTDGDILYLSPYTAGQITNIKPQAPLHTVIIGYVEYAHANNGKIYVKIDNGYELDELHNVRITTGSLTSGDLLVYSSSVWINTKQLTGSYGLTGSLNITGGITGSVTTASYALTASYVNPLVQNVIITGSVNITGSDNLINISPQASGNGIVINNSGYLKFNASAVSYIRGFSTGTLFAVYNSAFTNIFNIGTSAANYINTGTNFIVGTTTDIGGRLSVRGSGATSATTALRVENTNASASLVVRDDGSNLFVGSNGSSAGTWIDATGSMSIIRSTLGTTYGLRVYNGAGWSGHNAIQAIAYQYPIYGAQGSNGAESASPLSAGAGVYGQGGVGVYGKGITPSGDAGSIGVMATSLFVQSAGNTTLYNRSASAHIIGTSIFSGSVIVTGSVIASSFIGSLQGTASWATNVVTASAAGTNTMVQYNNNGVLGGTSKFTFDSGTALLFVDGGITTKNTVTVSGSLIVSGSSIITGSLQVGVPGTSAATIDTTVGTLGRGSVVSVDWVNRTLYDSAGVASTDWENRTSYDSAGGGSIDWGNRTLTDSAGNPSINWENRTLIDATNTYTALDYSSDTKITSDLYYNNIVGTAIQDVVADNAYYAGQTIEGTVDVGVSNFNLVSLDTDGTWKGVKATVGYGADKMLGICLDAGKGLVLIEGDIGVSDDNSQGPYIVGADHGLPVYIYTTTGQMTTTAPSGTNEIVRVVGHIYYQSTNDANLWTMKFRPSNDWYVI